MRISAEKSKIITTGIADDIIRTRIDINGEQLQQVWQFKYFGATISEMCNSETEIKARIGAATSALIRLDSIWRSRTRADFYCELMFLIFIYRNYAKLFKK